MWVVLEQRAQKKNIWIYQLMDIYSLQQDELTVSKYYHILKSKWDVDCLSEDTWESTCDQITHCYKEWKNKIFIFLRALNNDYENIRSEILNSGELISIKEVYSKLEAEK